LLENLNIGAVSDNESLGKEPLFSIYLDRISSASISLSGYFMVSSIVHGSLIIGLEIIATAVLLGLMNSASNWFSISLFYYFFSSSKVIVPIFLIFSDNSGVTDIVYNVFNNLYYKCSNFFWFIKIFSNFSNNWNVIVWLTSCKQKSTNSCMFSNGSSAGLSISG